MTNNEIYSYYHSKKQYFIRDIKEIEYDLVIHNHLGDVGILLTDKLNVLGIPRHQETLDALKNFDTDVRYTFSQPNQEEISVPFPECWRIQYDKNLSKWYINNNNPTQEQLDYYILMFQKIQLLDEINSNLTYQTYEFNNRATYNSYLDYHKLIETKHIIDNNITTDDTLNYPITSLYAREVGMSLYDAAKELKFKLDCDISLLAEINAVRVKFEKIIREETDLRNLKGILDQFNNHNFKYIIFNS